MSNEDYNAVLQHGIEKIREESSRRWKNLDHRREELLDFNSDEYGYGVVHGLEIAAKLLDILKVTALKEVA